jgi:hypothetical protein
MEALKPYGGDSVSRLTELINKDNEKPGREDIVFGEDFTLGLPKPFSGKFGENTQIILFPEPSAEFYEDPIPIDYFRLPLTALDRLPAGMVTSVPIAQLPFSIHDILPLINECLGIDLLADEVENTTYTTVLPRYPLRIIQDVSVAWIESDYAFPADHGDVEIDLADMIVTTDLNGLNYDPSL